MEKNALHMRKLADPQQPINEKRKLLQEVQVGKGVMSALETIILPYMRLMLKGLHGHGNE